MRRRRRKFSEEFLLLLMVPILGVAPLGLGATAAIGSSVLTVIAPIVPPTIGLASDNDGVTRNGVLTFVGEAAPRSTVTIFKGDEEIGSGRVEDEGTAYTIPITAIILSDGEYYFTAIATNAFGNSSPPAEPFKVIIDTTPPAYGSPTSSPAPNPNGWNNTDVTVRFPCADATSGPVTPEVVATISSEASNQTATADASQCVDLAGNPAAEGQSLAGISIDKTPPAYGSPTSSPAPNPNGWNNTDVMVHFPCADAISGPVEPEVVATISFEGSDQTATADASQCVDLAGNPAAEGQSLGGINVDKTGPSTVTGLRSLSHNLSTWSMARTIDVSWDGANDSLSGVEGYAIAWSTSATSTPDAITDGATVNRDASWDLPDGQSHYFHIRAVDKAGNGDAVAHLGPFWIDGTPPVTIIESAFDATGVSVANAGSTASDSVTIRVTGSDEFGIARFECRLEMDTFLGREPFGECPGSITYSGLPTGRYKLSVRAVDTAGNEDPTPESYTWSVVPSDPDLVVTSLAVLGPGSVNSQGSIEAPISVTVENQGTGEADIFKVSTEYTGGSATFGGTYTVGFTVPGQSSVWYPYTSGLMAAGDTVTFQGVVTFAATHGGQTVSLTAVADSCSGDELMPSYCRVNESDESNNKSQSIEVQLPSPLASLTLDPQVDTGTNQVTISWDSVGGVAPFTGTLTAGYSDQRSPYSVYGLDSQSGRLVDAAPLRCEGTSIIQYTIELYDSTGQSMAASARTPITWIC